MLFDYLFIVTLALEWTAVFALFLLKRRLLQTNNDSFKARAWLDLVVTGPFLGIIFLKILHVVLLVVQLQQKAMDNHMVLQLAIHILWQLLVCAMYFYLILKFSIRKNFQQRFALTLSKNIFAQLVFVAIWDMMGGLFIYFLLSANLLLGQFELEHVSVPFQEPAWSALYLLGLVIIAMVSLLSFWNLKKETNKFSLTLYSFNYLVLVIFCLFTVIHYKNLLFADLRQILNQFHLFLAVLSWIIIFLFSVIVFLMMIQLYYNRQKVKTGFQYQYLMYNLSRLHLWSELGLTFTVAVPVLFFIYY